MMRKIIFAVILGLYGILCVASPIVSHRLQEKRLDFLAKPVALLAIYPPQGSEKEKPNYYWLFESADPKTTGGVTYWAIERNTSKLEGELQSSNPKSGGGRFNEGALKFTLDFKVQTDGASTTRRFFAPLDSSKTYRVEAAHGSENKLSFGVPAPEKYKGQDAVEVSKEDKTTEIPILGNATISEIKQK